MLVASMASSCSIFAPIIQRSIKGQRGIFHNKKKHNKQQAKSHPSRSRIPVTVRLIPDPGSHQAREGAIGLSQCAYHKREQRGVRTTTDAGPFADSKTWIQERIEANKLIEEGGARGVLLLVSTIQIEQLLPGAASRHGVHRGLRR